MDHKFTTNSILRKLQTLFILSLLGASSCSQAKTETPTPVVPPVVVESRIVFSEIVAGIDGNNNFDFIELHNTGDEIVDLMGWSIWYRLADDKEEIPIYRWESQNLIPPRGHYLLGRSGQEFGLAIDAEFGQSLVLPKGGLQLRNSVGMITDTLGWGNAPESYTEGVPAPAMQNGFSLERTPGGELGNGEDTNDNASDFTLDPAPDPQNTGSPITPDLVEHLEVGLSAPESVEPGDSFEYTLSVSNTMPTTANDVAVEFPIPSGLDVNSPPPGVSIKDGLAAWTIGTLIPGERIEIQVRVTTPVKYLTLVGRDYYVMTSDSEAITFGRPVWTFVRGGTLPITIARTLVGDEVTIEGISTMYTDGFYAGSGAKFYLEDESGGVQVYVPGAGGTLDIPLDAHVRVQGVVELYRGAVEIIPDVIDKVEILGTDQSWHPSPITLHQAVIDLETLPGRLVQIEGTATRIEEFSYSYEVDLVDDEGQKLTLYIDKLTEFNAELLEIGTQYQAIGILEVRDTFQRLNPRLQSDLSEILPPILFIDAMAPSSVHSGDTFTVTLTVFNNTGESLQDLRIWIPLPAAGAVLDEILDGGELEAGQINWSVSEIATETSVSRSYTLRALDGVEQIVSENYGASASEWPDPAGGQPLRVFVGSGVPIWAIQGSGFNSPYKLVDVNTSGIVTGIFPEMGGFWIEETETDDDPNTSAGVFIFVGDTEVLVEPGDKVELHGKVHEISQQTEVHVESPEDIFILARGSELPEVITLDPPVDETASNEYFEALEGMLVRVVDPAVAVSPTSRFGEYVLVPSHHQVERVYRGDDIGMLIMVDDGSYVEHFDRANLPYVVKTGDRVSGLLGPLAYTYGHYKIEPIKDPIVEATDSSVPILDPTSEDEFSIMTWNVENLFDLIDPHPSSPPRPMRADYEITLTKIANTIISAGIPTVIGLQEVENIGILEDLRAHELLIPFQYQPVLMEGTDSRGIDVGYLVRGDRTEILSSRQIIPSEGLTSRPPLLLDLNVHAGESEIRLFVINNHFSSMSGGETVTEPRRVAEAELNVSIVEELLIENPDAFLAVIGDLNSFYESPPIDTLRESGILNAFDFLPPSERYTYIYQGVSQTLDHILISQALEQLLLKVEVLHVNSDFPPPEQNDDSQIRESDHDPVVATFSID
jgi:uncharacterized repeat protein (TIGR01451 family)